MYINANANNANNIDNNSNSDNNYDTSNNDNKNDDDDDRGRSLGGRPRSARTAARAPRRALFSVP